jgi:hypothetical protein
MRLLQSLIKDDVLIKIAVILIAVISPFIMIGTQGFMPSISSYWTTPMQSLFIITNASTSYFLFSTRTWRIPAIFLLGLTAFSVENFQILHNCLAVIFFITNIFALYKIRRFRLFIPIYVVSAIWLLHSITLAEIWAILVLCVYHLILLVSWKNIRSHKNK